MRGETKYPPQDGTRRLKQAVQRKFRRDTGLEFALDEIMVANGGKQVIFDALMATVDEGDEVVMPAPYWGAYALMTRMVGGEPVAVTCPQNNGFKPRPEDLEAAITPRTKWLMLNFPNNPTGAACSADELRALGEVMLRHPARVDHVRRHVRAPVYDGRRTPPWPPSSRALRDRTLTVSGVSKTYAMTGWRIGFGAGPKRADQGRWSTCRARRRRACRRSGRPPPPRRSTARRSSVAVQAAAYRRRRDLVVDALNAAPGIACHRPEGAFYVFPNIAGCLGRTTAGGTRIDTDEDFALACLEEAHVALVHGAAFGMSPYLRISYATDEQALEEGCRRIDRFVRAFR